MEKILVVNVNWIGDVIFSSPVFRALRQQYPQAHIACLAVPRVKDVLESIPDIDEIIIYDERGKDKFLFGKWRILKKLRQSKFDAVFLLHRSWTRALLMYLARIPIRVGYPAKKRERFLTHCVQELDGNIHRSDHYLNVVESFGVAVHDRSTYLSVNESSVKELNDVLYHHQISEEEQIGVCHVGANWELKRWPAENFVGLIDQLSDKMNIKIVISGAKSDKMLAESIADQCRNKPVVIAGKTDLKQLMALMKRAAYVISADSGPLHIASSVGARTVGIFGPTKTDITGPRGIGKTQAVQKDVGCNRQACYFLECPDNTCMQAVTVENVINAIE